jgi:hypothetical protein
MRMPELVLIEIAAALAAKSTESMYDLVRNKFKSRKQVAVLSEAGGAPGDSPQVIALAEEIAAAESSDQQFSSQLRHTWAEIQTNSVPPADGVFNSVGRVQGNVVQARDIHGNISFGRDTCG